ncbi:MAG: biotin transporter BioY [Armatimonadetes bacterium]|nr:biotin transporter BioY [Armatimonadota bacterium]
MTFVDALSPRRERERWLYDAAWVVAGSLLVALSARVAIPLYPVPVTGQTFAVLLVGACLGSRRGTAAMLLYLLEGLAGMPVFAEGKAGAAALLGPTGGYLLGSIPAAFVVGRLCESGWDRKLRSAAAVFLIGNILFYLVGLPWLARFVGTGQMLSLGLYPFIPGDLLKIALATSLLPSAWKLAQGR